MLTKHKANQILKLIKYIYTNELKGEEIRLIEDNDKADATFSFLHIGSCNCIFFIPEFKKDIQSEYMMNFIINNLENEAYRYMPNLLECFALLHEIGHWLQYVILGGDLKEGYAELKTKGLLPSSVQSMKEYREIPAEKLADDFAISIINIDTKKLWLILDPTINEQEQESLIFDS